MDTASSSPAEAEGAALVRAHLVAALTTGVVVCALSMLAAVQLVWPGVLGDAAWLGVGRLRTAAKLAILVGLCGNAFAAFVYGMFPSALRLVVRLRVSALKFAVWNFVISAPIVILALLGRLPTSGAFELIALSSVPSLITLYAISGFFFSMPRRNQPRYNPSVQIVMTFGFLGAMVANHGADVSMRPWSTMRWSELVVAVQPYWKLEIATTALLGAGFVAALWFLMPGRLSEPSVVVPTGRWGRFMDGLFGLLLLSLPVFIFFDGPPTTAGMVLTSSEARGRAVFVREGCATCHGDSEHTRIAPDLELRGGARTPDWQFTHLFSARALTPRTVMPSFTHLFNGAPDQPKQSARDLVAFLDALGRAKDLRMSEADAAKANPARARRAGEVPTFPKPAAPAEQQRLYLERCAGCHGPKGEGDGPAAAGLRPRPANLAAHRYTTAHAAAVLWNGVAGTAMPAWRDEPWYNVASLIAAAQSFGDEAAQKNAGSGEQAGLRSADTDLGARVYAANCSQCHGERGGGDGFSAASLPVAPANFQRQQPTLGYALRAIAVGVEGTPMAPWTARLGEDEVLAVAHYVRSLYTGGEK
ncbi:MAG: c-type cytochrome [Acidobacteriota bacterium]